MKPHLFKINQIFEGSYSVLVRGEGFVTKLIKKDFLCVYFQKEYSQISREEIEAYLNDSV